MNLNWMALLGIVAGIYGLFCLYVAIKKPEKIWDMAKIRGFRKVLGDVGTQIFFSVFSLAMIALGVWLIVKDMA